MRLNQAQRYWLIGFGCLGLLVLAHFIIWTVFDCPPCVNPITYDQRRANAIVSDSNRNQKYFLLENKESLPLFLKSKCLKQIGSYIFVCQAIDTTSAFPSVFNYAISKRNDLKSYVGGAFVVKTAEGKKTVQSLVCEAKKPGVALVNHPIDPYTCGSGTIKVEEQFIP